MEITVRLKKEWVPTWNGNEEDDNPIVVVHKSPTMSLKEQLIPKPRIKFKVDAEGTTGGESEMELDVRKIVEMMLVEIKNCSLKIVDPDTEKEEILEIKTAKDLYSPKAPSIIGGLADEIGSYFQRILQEAAETKN